MTEDYSAVRNRLHRKSHSYFVFAFGRWDRSRRAMFYGATDALLDTTQAAASYANVISSNTGSNLLACYGFLQALYIQQDAVGILSRSMGLTWKPENSSRLAEIREIRNRLTGHPALAGDKRRSSLPSSAIIPYQEIGVDGFNGQIYYEDRSETVSVDVESFQKDNEELLTEQMLTVEKIMNQSERKFRSERSAPSLSTFFENGFRYLMERLHCDLNNGDRVIQARTHLKMIRERVIELEKELSNRELGSELAPKRVVVTGLDLLEKLLEADASRLDTQDEFDLIYSGLEKEMMSLIDSVKDLDQRLSEPVE